MTRNANEALEAIVTERGALISSADCTPAEIAIARSCGRFFVRDDGMGFVLRPNEWLRMMPIYQEIAQQMDEVLKHFDYVLKGKGWVELQTSIEKVRETYQRLLRGDAGGEAEAGANDPPAEPGSFRESISISGKYWMAR